MKIHVRMCCVFVSVLMCEKRAYVIKMCAAAVSYLESSSSWETRVLKLLRW